MNAHLRGHTPGPDRTPPRWGAAPVAISGLEGIGLSAAIGATTSIHFDTQTGLHPARRDV
jgi:hypothetical protein